MRRLLAFVAPLLLGQFLVAQDTVVVSLDTAQILIGAQTKLHLSITYRQGATIVWPAIADTIASHVDVVKDSGIDTVVVDPKNDPTLRRQSRTLTITSFDSGYWAIPPFRFVLDPDTIDSRALLLAVNTVEVDTAKAFRGIKDIIEVPSATWQEWLREHWKELAISLATMVVIIVVVNILVKRRRRKKAVVPVEPELPLYMRTLNALRDVEAKKLWQQGLVKQYHSEITDILRGYVEARFNVPALESTTDELMQHLRLSAMNSAHREQLGNMLRFADMVKFAKYTALPAENEQLMIGALRLVEDTAVQEPVNDAPRS